MAATTTRVFAILARQARKAVIFRRGPSKHVQLIKWHLDSDTLEFGQWFKGRIYERRCDLSPSGELLIYLAAKFRCHDPMGSWTAISKPPYLTALALWPGTGSWGGGGIFEEEDLLLLNQSPRQDPFPNGYKRRKSMRVEFYKGQLDDGPLGWHQLGSGGDFPIYHSLLLKNQWRHINEEVHGKSEGKLYKYGGNFRPFAYEKPCRGLRLQMQFKGTGQKNQPRYLTNYAVFNSNDELLLDLPRTDWADWDGHDLVIAKKGKLFRLTSEKIGRNTDSSSDALKPVADLNDLKFSEVIAPPDATEW